MTGPTAGLDIAAIYEWVCPEYPETKGITGVVVDRMGIEVGADLWYMKNYEGQGMLGSNAYEVPGGSNCQLFMSSGFKPATHGALFDPGDERDTRWGRAVMAAYADLVSIPPRADAERIHLGGCPCVTLAYAALQDKIPGFDPTGEVCERITGRHHI